MASRLVAAAHGFGDPTRAALKGRTLDAAIIGRALPWVARQAGWKRADADAGSLAAHPFRASWALPWARWGLVPSHGSGVVIGRSGRGAGTMGLPLPWVTRMHGVSMGRANAWGQPRMRSAVANAWVAAMGRTLKAAAMDRRGPE